MVCADTNVWVAFLAGEETDDTSTLALALRLGHTRLAPPVIAELRSFPDLSEDQRTKIARIPVFHLLRGFWERVGDTRASLLRLGHRPKLADTLIAQVCIDHDIPLLTPDRGFAPFAKHSGLHLAK